jgi:hypothetical protein
MDLAFVDASELSGGAFSRLDSSSGVALDVLARMANSSGQSPTSVRLTLEETREGGTRGGIVFDHAMGSAGKDLGELAVRSVKAVDPGVRF